MKAKQESRKVDKKLGKQAGKPAVKRKDEPPKGGSGGPDGHVRLVSYELRRKAVKLYLEERIPAGLVAKELGISRQTVFDWVKRYREQGEAGLQTRYAPEQQRRTNGPLTAVHEKIVEVKRANPDFGVKRISQLLRRMFFLPASTTMVRRTLVAKQLMPVKKKTRRNPAKPRFFERSTPNQMWQSDIFPFHLSGQMAYLIGFIDDHSRYLVGLGLYRSQTAENVLEVYQRATGEYGVPKEMLTDNGRQYTNWRGKTRFEKVLQRDRVHHFRSSPHHPQTLGKIERFWKTIWEEFLDRAQFDTFESARERIAWWVKYYNQQRPHQGIGGLCPADRFFAIQKELGEVMKKGLAANLKELALRGKPQEPVYVVGRVGERSVVIRAEQGTVRMTVGEREGGADECDNGEKSTAGQESSQCEGKRDGVAGGVVGAAAHDTGVQGAGGQLGAVQQLGEEGHPGDPGCAGGSAGQATDGTIGTGSTGAPAGILAGESRGIEGSGGSGKCGTRAGEELNSRNDEEVCDENGRDGNGHGEPYGDGSMPGRTGGVAGETHGGAGLSGDGGDAQGFAAMAGARDGGDAAGVAAAGGSGGRAGSSALAQGETVAGSQGAGTGGAVAPADQAVGERGDAAGGGVEGTLSGPVDREVSHEESGARGGLGEDPSGTDHTGPSGATDGLGGSRPDGGVTKDLLQVGATGPLGDCGGVEGWGGGTPSGAPGPGEGSASTGGGATAAETGGPGATPADQGSTAGRATG